jgi:hypothetical protein
MGNVNRRIAVHAGLGLKQDPVSKILKANRAEAVTQVADSYTASTRP